MKPVVVLGAGARGSDFEHLMSLGIPVLTSWQAMDLVDNFHPMYYGRPGLYGQRCANKILYNADQVIAIGCRMAIWTVGYADFAPNAQLTMVDIDPEEIRKHPSAIGVLMDAKEFIAGMSPGRCDEWVKQCDYWREMWPWVESPAHDDTVGFINSYRFMERLQPMLKPDQVIVTDMGAALTSAHQVLRLKPPQRIMTSGGLGEMGCALPAAIGASFARNKGEVLCLNCDGGMMLNLQELQTIVHHKLPIKIVVFANDGYAMIKHTQNALGLARTATDTAGGLSCPNFVQVGRAFGLGAVEVISWEDFDRVIPYFMGTTDPVIAQVRISPLQAFVPKLNPVMVDGKPTSPTFDNLSPCLS